MVWWKEEAERGWPTRARSKGPKSRWRRLRVLPCPSLPPPSGPHRNHRPSNCDRKRPPSSFMIANTVQDDTERIHMKRQASLVIHASRTEFIALDNPAFKLDTVPENVENVKEFESPPPPRTSYAHPFPEEVEFAKEPPVLPPQLHLSSLGPQNTDDSVPEKPQHVVLNHAFIEKGCAAHSVVALGLTHRCQSKYRLKACTRGLPSFVLSKISLSMGDAIYGEGT